MPRTGLPERLVPRRFYRRDPRDVAPDLLNKVLVHDDPATGRLAGRIVEVEAYVGLEDAGSHAFRGLTSRNATMFGPPGHLYVYFTYGMHWCTNVVCSDDGVAGAVLLRALAPVEGLEVMRSRRFGGRPRAPGRPAGRSDRELCSGPARLAQALGLDGSFDGNDLLAGPVRLVDDGVAPPPDPGTSRRVGLSEGRGDEHPWRWYVPGDPNVSRKAPG